MAKIDEKKLFIISGLFILTVYLMTSRYVNPSNSINMFISNQIEKIKAKIEAKNLKPITPTGNCRIVNTIEAMEKDLYIALGYAHHKNGKFPHQWAVKNPDYPTKSIVDKSIDGRKNIKYEPKVIIKLEKECKAKIIKKYPMDKYTKWLVFKGITYTEEFCKTYKRK